MFSPWTSNLMSWIGLSSYPFGISAGYTRSIKPRYQRPTNVTVEKFWSI